MWNAYTQNFCSEHEGVKPAAHLAFLCADRGEFDIHLAIFFADRGDVAVLKSHVMKSPNLLLAIRSNDRRKSAHLANLIADI